MIVNMDRHVYVHTEGKPQIKPEELCKKILAHSRPRGGTLDETSKPSLRLFPHLQNESLAFMTLNLPVGAKDE